MARPKTDTPKENMLFIKVDADLKERIQERASAEGLSMSAWIRQAAIKALGKKGV